MVMAAQRCASRRLAKLGLPRSMDMTQPRTFPPSFFHPIPHQSETDAQDRVAMWLAAEQHFCPDHKEAISADQVAARRGPG